MKQTFARLFFRGLGIYLPFAVTFFLVIWAFLWITEPFYALLFYATEQPWIARLLSVFVWITLTIMLGFFAQLLVIQRMLLFMHRLFLKVPYFKRIYRSLHDVIITLLERKQKPFSRVVRVAYPDQYSKVIAFVTNEETCLKLSNGDTYLPVFIPGAPNPFMGFLVFMPPQELQETSLCLEDALKWSLSLGIIQEETDCV